MEDKYLSIGTIVKQNWKYLFLILLFTELLILTSSKIDYNNPIFINSDFNKYLTMANASPQISHEVIKPFVYRIVIPWIAGILPFSIINNFILLDYFALIFLSFSIFIFLIDNYVSEKLSFLLTNAFLFNRYFFQFNIWNYFQSGDVISLGILFLSFGLLKRKSWFTLFLIFPISVLVKEYILLFLPAGFVYLYFEKSSVKNFFTFSILSLSSIFVYIIIRKIIISEGGESLYIQYTTQVIYYSKPILLVKRFLVPFTPFGLIPIIFYKETILFFRKYFYLFVYSITVIILSFFGEPERLMAPLSLVYLLFLAGLLQKIYKENNGLKLRIIFTIIFLTLTIIASFYHLWGILVLPTKEISMILTFAVNILMSALLFVFINFEKFKRLKHS